MRQPSCFDERLQVCGGQPSRNCSVKDPHSGYRGTALLAGVVCLGWAWDAALGGGRVHAVAWLTAVAIVAGISLLAAHAARLAGHAAAHPPAAPELVAGQLAEPAPAIAIRPAVANDLPVLIEIEIAADTLFEVAGYGKTPGPASIDELSDARLLLVAVASTTENQPVGYVRLEVVDEQAHIEGLSVRPKWMRHGIGTALVNAACDWAVEQGFSTMTLCTFADVPWNGPFYAQLGFREQPVLTPQLQELRGREEHLGLDAMGRRCVMRKQLADQRVAEELPAE